MIISVRANLNEIFMQGRKFKWIKPCNCPRCGSVRLWGHGFVLAYFDGFSQGLLLRLVSLSGLSLPHSHET